MNISLNPNMHLVQCYIVSALSLELFSDTAVNSMLVLSSQVLKIKEAADA